MSYMAWSDEDRQHAQDIRANNQSTRYTDLRDSVVRSLMNGDKAGAQGYYKAFQDRMERGERDKPPTLCFITTAVCDSFGKADDCYELTAFRNFRDKWLVNQSDGKNLIAEYYEVAPKIVEKINSLSNAAEIYKNIWNDYLSDCLKFIEVGDNLNCKKIYVNMVNALKEKFLK